MNENIEKAHFNFNEVNLALSLVFHDHNVSLKNLLMNG